VSCRGTLARERGISRDSRVRIKLTMGEARCLSCLVRSILGGGHSGAVFELFGEAAGIDEASFAGDLGGGEAGFIEEAHGGRTRVLKLNSWGAEPAGQALPVGIQVAGLGQGCMHLSPKFRMYFVTKFAPAPTSEKA